MPNSDKTKADTSPGASLCPLILASASPRRRELMERFWPGQLQVMVPQLEEEPVLARFTDDGGCLLADPSADRTLEQLARALPAAKIAALSGQAVLPPDCCLVAADTLVVVDNQVVCHAWHFT